MGRRIELERDKAVVRLTGLTGFFALKMKLGIPYETISQVYVDQFDAPRWMLRMPGTSISFLHIYEGSYKYRNEWYFLSFSGRGPVLLMELKGHPKYRLIVLQIEHPTKTAADIRTQLRLREEK
ncbi:hypothetical protein CEF21_14545 [Bacillus sp. FJAT-42376]|uniref:hypothetical protein n=1 Tax=Bacillus sp. FJAT-42376 TaxID=2014076 RepID=UPI000F4DFD56|nr:hypothetical protein [Bacillus sp. FJAT-42376]AZB43426.1 hypothetical protein CEF21_14545 [Bacillus sp. FJAT-42376]